MDLVDVRAVSRQLDIDQVLFAYTNGLFPMGLSDGGNPPYGWWSPRYRGVLKPGGLKISKSLRKSMCRFTFSLDTAFAEVVEACADSSRPGAWITPEMQDMYLTLHAREIAHSVEVWHEDTLVGGLFGLRFGDLFTGESMFHRARDASKAALVHLVEHLDNSSATGEWLIDTQWSTPHLESLGVSEIPSFEYIGLAKTLSKPHLTQEFPINSAE